MTQKAFYQTFDKYFETFGDVFPMMKYDLSDEDAVKLMEECISKNKPASEIRPLNKNFIY